MTKGEEERLGIVETQVQALQLDVTEVKSDVKSMMAVQNTIAVSLAAKDAAAEQHQKDRAATGIWARSVVPWVFMGTGIILTIVNTFDILKGT